MSWHLEKYHNLSNNKNCADLDSSDGVLDCYRCGYQAEDEYDIFGHFWIEHEEDEGGHTVYKFCGEKFAYAANLMKHREKDGVYKYFNDWGCSFEDIKCWFFNMRNEEKMQHL